jgi:hypothetical protein
MVMMTQVFASLSSPKVIDTGTTGMVDATHVEEQTAIAIGGERSISALSEL